MITEMTGFLYIAFNAFSLSILLMMLRYIFKGVDKRMEQIMLGWFIIASIIFCLSDIFWGIVEFYIGWGTREDVSFFANAIYHVFSVVVSFLWFLYSESMQKAKTVTTKAGLCFSLIPLAIMIFIIMDSYRRGWIFYINGDGEYSRGPLYGALSVVCCIYIYTTAIKAFVKALKKENYINKQEYMNLASFIICPTFAMIGQVIFVGSPMISAGIALAVLSVYVKSREQLISVDPMTGLNNRSHMEKYLYQKMKNKSDSKELIVYIMDLDYFKSINDRFGHVEGDQAIMIAAETIKELVGKLNYFGCRYGGDEFVVVAETNNDYNPKDFLNQANALLKEKATCMGKEYDLHFSVGYKRYSAEYTNVPEFIQAADEGLYMIKNSRNRKSTH